MPGGDPGHLNLGQAGRSTTIEGNRLYEQGRFDEAHEKYLDALREAPDSPIIRFNDGSALYQGHLYGFDGQQGRPGRLVCMEFGTGKVKWAEKGFAVGVQDQQCQDKRVFLSQLRQG